MSLLAAFWTQNMDLSLVRERIQRREAARRRAQESALTTPLPCEPPQPRQDPDARPSHSTLGASCLLTLLLCLPSAPARAIVAGEEIKTVSTLATLPLGQLFNDNTYTPVVSFRGATYFVWINSDNRPKVGVIKNGMVSSSYLSSNSAYTIRNDGHHYFSMGVDKNGYLHVTGDMHNYPTGYDQVNYPAEYQNKIIMYWVSSQPESIASFDFVGGDAARAMPGYGFSYHSFAHDQDRELYFMARIKVHKGGHQPGEMGVGMFRYDSNTRAWTALGGLAPSSTTAIYKSVMWENNGESDNGGWYQGYRASMYFDLDNRAHFAACVVNDQASPDPTHALYGRSDDRGVSFKRADGSAVTPPLRVDAGANQGDIVMGPAAFDLYASVGANRAGLPWVGFSEILDHQYFSYKYRLTGGGWSNVVRDPFGTYIRGKYKLDAFGVLALFSPSGQYRRLNDFTSAGYNDTVGANSSFIGVDDLGLRENNDFIGISKNSSLMSVVRLRLAPNLAALPTPWSPNSLGSVSSPQAGQFNGVLALGGASSGLGGATDQARVAWQDASGDIDVKVRVMSLSWSHNGAQAGLMLRQGTGASAPMAAALITYGQGAKLVTRSVDSGTALVTSKAGHTAAEWLRLTRQGTLVSAYRSDNGQSWQLIGTQTLALSSGLKVGLIHASGDAAVAGAARFDNFTLSAAPALSPSATLPPNASFTATRSATRSATPSSTSSVTAGPSRSASPTSNRTPTAIASASATPAGSPSESPTFSESPTSSHSPTHSSTYTESPVSSASPSPSASPTRSNTAQPSKTASPSATYSPTARPSATRSPTPKASATRTPSPAPTNAAQLEVFHQSSDAVISSGPHHKIQIKNKTAASINLVNVEARYWLKCDCGSEGLQAYIDWAGLQPSGSAITANIAVISDSSGGQTHYLRIRFSSGSLPAGSSAEVQFRFNRGNWANSDQSNDYSWASHPSLISWNKVSAYLSGTKVWGIVPGALTARWENSPKDGSSTPAALSLLIAPNPLRGQGQALLSLPKPGHAALEIRDIQGSLISRQELGLQAAGQIQQDINYSGLAPGLYFATLELKVDALETQRTHFKLAIQ